MSTTVAIGPAFQGAFSSSTSLSAPSVIASVTVDFDKGVFLQMAMFAIAILLLKPLLFDPMLRLFALREERTDGARAEARHMQERAAEILRNYELEVTRVRADATQERDVLRKETAQQEAQILAQARSAAEKIAEEGQAKIAADVQSLQADLVQRSAQLASQIVATILRRGTAS
jgi:F-type H+-transporting ATPase subunit b